MKSEFDYLKSALNLMYEGVYFVDTEMRIGFWNKGAELITGFLAEEILGSRCSDNILNHVTEFGDQLCMGGCPLSRTLSDEKEREDVVYLHHKNGQRVKVNIRTTPIYNRNRIVRAAEVFKQSVEQQLFVEDVDSLRNKSYENLKQLALYDQLTGLPNRRYLETLLISKLSEQKLLSIPFGTVLVDIDDFRNVNNNFGHNIGDKVLRMVGGSLLSSMSKDDVVGRWGGEEFLAILSDTNMESMKRTMERMRVLVKNALLRENNLNIGVSISLGGTIALPEDTSYSLVERTDKLMYKSKFNGKNCWTIG